MPTIGERLSTLAANNRKEGGRHGNMTALHIEGGIRSYQKIPGLIDILAEVSGCQIPEDRISDFDRLVSRFCVHGRNDEKTRQQALLTEIFETFAPDAMATGIVERAYAKLMPEPKYPPFVLEGGVSVVCVVRDDVKKLYAVLVKDLSRPSEEGLLFYDSGVVYKLGNEFAPFSDIDKKICRESASIFKHFGCQLPDTRAPAPRVTDNHAAMFPAPSISVHSELRTQVVAALNEIADQYKGAHQSKLEVLIMDCERASSPTKEVLKEKIDKLTAVGGGLGYGRLNAALVELSRQISSGEIDMRFLSELAVDKNAKKTTGEPPRY